MLTGELPDELCELPNLEELILGNVTHSRGSEIQEFNHFEGPIPENIGNLKKLRQLDISTAGISGEIPASICELSNLEVICLGNATAEVSNYLTGKLPADIGKLKNLSGFDVSNNNIEGTITAGFAELSQLSSLLLYGNRLQGLIPQELINSPRWSSWNPDVFILPQQPGYFLLTDEHISTDFSADGEFYALQTATQGDGVDIVLIGDGFTDVDIADGAYETTMRQAMENFFAREPIASFRDRFNVYVVNAVSTNRGIGGNTALNCRYGSDTFISGDDNRCMDYASKVPGVDLARTLVIVILNDTKYAGTTNMYSNNFAIAYCPIVDGLSSDRFVGIILHEAVGHGFAKLADEYVYPEMGAIPQELVEQYSAQKLNGWWANADFTADPAAVSWASFISDPRYEAEGVSVYEGALTYTEGAYRPTLTSLMDQNVGDFNAPSRESIYKRVMELSGESYSRDKFLDYDAVNRTSAAVAARAAAARAIAGRRFTPLHPPVLKEFNR